MSQGQPTTTKAACSSESKIRPGGFTALVSDWNKRHPVFSIAIISLLAVVINGYPIIFCGKSYVSPLSAAGSLVYNWWPPLPGMESGPPPEILHSVHGSDTQAMMWWGVPVGFIESRSLLEQGTLPLWNRFGHAGGSLIGQAVSMLGDPLHLIVILGHGSAWAWDLKFLTAKFIFCMGFGWLILRLLQNRTLSLIFAALGAYCGAFFFIYSHPVFFVFSYAPWILLAACEWLDLRSRHHFRWGLIWLLANFACFNAGHVEVAVVLIVGLNLAAVAGKLIDCRNLANSVKVLIRMGVGTLLFLGLTAPVWMSFLAALTGSFTVHEKISVNQIAPTAMPGLFDDLFYLLYRDNDALAALAPGTSLLILSGCVLSVVRWRQLKNETFFWINTGAIALCGSCIFGPMPTIVLAAIPLLNRVAHTNVDFSYLLIIHLTIQCAYGFSCLTQTVKLRRVTADFACIGAIFIGVFILYSFGFWHQPIPWTYFLGAGLGAIGAPLLYVILKACQRPTLIWGWLGIIILGIIPNYRFGLYNSGNDNLLMLPGPRVVLNAPSRAIEKIKADKTGPNRVVGLGWNFMGDYSAVYGLEDIRSCAPLSNAEVIDLIRSFPGVEATTGWKFKVVDPVLAQPLLNLLNVKYVLAPPDITGDRPGFRVTDRSDFGVMENLQVWPRAFFANQVMVIESSERFVQELSTNGLRPFIALTKEEIEKQTSLEQLTPAGQTIITAATHYALLPNSTEFDIHAPSAGMVCLTEGQAKDFTVTANAEVKQVRTVNRAFKGVYLDKAGDYHVKFIYRPRHWRLACACFWSALAATGALIWLRLRSFKKPC